ncbi:MAG TPA: M28 family metallopeptidase [Chloroflexota bacterium]|nr:M28 family metallopeptidase [Chloroflexota bacterium]
MTRLTALLLAVLTTLSLTYAPAAASARAAPGAVPDTRAENAPAFSGAAAFQHVEALSVGIGSRVAGSPAQSQTHQYLMARFQELGYQVELQPFTITAYQDRGSSAVLAEPLGQTISTNTLQYSAGGAVEAPLVEAGLGKPDDFAVEDVRGKVALVTRGDTRFAEKVDAATSASAVAVIIVNNQPGNFNGSLVSMSTIPVVSVSQADGATLRQAARSGAAVRVEVNASNEQSTGANVVATRPGGAQTLVIGGHIDSVAAGPGANDNASGTAVVLELARVMASRDTPFTLKFIGFDAEEIGLVGSNYYVSQLPEAERRSIAAMINLDMVGVGDSSRVGGSESLVRLAQASASRSGLTLGLLGDGGGSDHASFLRAGIPGLFIHRTSDPNYHSPNDRAHYIDPANLQVAGQLALDVVASLERGE